MSNGYFPDDLLRDVLSGLPVKSLVRFKCVSRSWYLMIDSPDFIKIHGKRSEKTESSRKLIAGGLHHKVCKLYDVDFNLPESSEAKNMEEVNYPSMMYDSDKGITFAGSCNGLLCLVYSKRYTTRTVLWNPSTRKHLKLPICSKQYRETLTILDDCVHGFGYDEVADDYKVVRMVKYRDQQFIPTFSVFFIYSLKSNEWRSLEDFPYVYDLKWWIDGVFTNGALHWLLEDNFILAFSLGTEGFQLIPPPEASSKFQLVIAQVLDGCLLLLCQTFSFGACEMWVMKNYGIKDSWTKIALDLSTNKHVWGLVPFELLKSDKHIILKTCFSMNIVICDLEEQSFQEVTFPVKLDNVKACIYFESLVRLDGGGGDGTAGMSGKQNNRRGRNRIEGISSAEKKRKGEQM